MFGKTFCAFVLLVLLASVSPIAQNRAAAQGKAALHESAETQDESKPLDPNDPRLTFSFPIHPGTKPLRFKVELNQTGNITGISVFRSGDSHALQTLPACESVNLMQQVTEN
jgi:hypothetical protein